MKPRPFPRLTKTELKRFFQQVKHTKNCWVWSGYCRPDGYGHMTITRNGETRSILVHRISYQELKKTLSRKLILDHRCQNKLCVKPQHLREVTDRVNILASPSQRAAQNALKTHCLRGHPLSGRNLSINSTSGSRICLICSNETKRRWARKHEALQQGGADVVAE